MAGKKEIKMSQQQLLDTYRVERGKLDMLQQKMQGMQQAMAEILTAAEALKELGKAKKDESTLVSLGAGIYAEGKIGGVKHVKRSLPGNVLVNESLDSAEKKLQEERQKLEKALVAAENDRRLVMQNVANFEKVFAQIEQKGAAQRAAQGQEGQSSAA